MDRVAATGQDLAGDVVQRHVIGKDANQVTMKAVDTAQGNRFAIRAHHIGPLEGPELGVLLSLQQGLDQLSPLVRGIGLEELPCLLGRRDGPNGVEVDTAEEDRVTCQWSWIELKFPLPGENMLVDKVLFRGRSEGELVGGADVRETSCFDQAQVADQDRCFGSIGKRNPALGTHHGSGIVGRGENSKACHVLG